jgi:hypothetical protein
MTVKRIVPAIFTIVASPGSATAQVITPAFPSTMTSQDSPFSQRVAILCAATATPAIGPCSRPNGRWPYAYPEPSTEMDFVSAPDPANGDEAYKGGIASTLVDNRGTYGIFVRNTGIYPISIRADDFTLNSLYPSAIWPMNVQPGTQSRFELRIHGGGNPSQSMEWQIAGRFGSIVVPYREPTGRLLAPIQIGCG